MLRWFTTIYGILSGFMIAGISRISRKGPLEFNEDEAPSLAIVIAARDEEKNLPELFRALSSQEYPTNKVHFWIVDDDSSDNTLALIKEMEKRDNRFHALKSDKTEEISSPKKRALNSAIRQIDSDWIVTTDADCMPSPGWLRGLATYMEPDVGAIVGYVPLVGKGNPLQYLSMGKSWSNAALNAAGCGLGFPFSAIGANFAFRRSVYVKLGGYGADANVASGDDDLFLQRIASKTDYRVHFAGDQRTFVKALAPEQGRELKTQVRHMSVGTKYPPGWVLIGAIGSALFLGLGLASIISLVGIGDKTSVRKAWIRKWLYDAAMIIAAGRVLGDPKRAVLALTAMSSAPFFLWYIWPMALFKGNDWKGRSYKAGMKVVE